MIKFNLGLCNHPMGGAAALISRPNHRNFLCTKTNYQKPGGGGEGEELIGIGIDRDMNNWEFSKTVLIIL